MIERVILKTVEWTIRHPKRIVFFSLVLLSAAAAFLPRLHVSTDRNLLAGKDNASFAHRESVNRLFGTSLSAVVVLEGSDRAALEAAAKQLSAKLKQHDDWISDVFYKVDKGFFEQHALLYMSESEIRGMIDGLAQALPALADGNGAPSLSAGLLGMEKMLAAGASQTADTGGYLTENDGKTPLLRILFVQPKSNSQAMEAVEPLTALLRKEAAWAVADHEEMHAYVTGMPAVVTDEMHAVSRDCFVSGAVAGIGVLLIFMIAFRSLRVTLFVVIPLGVGLILSAGLAAVLFGRLTLITSYFAAVLFGLGVDFSIHLVARFHEALRASEDKSTAVRTALTQAGPATIVGGATTMFAFLAIGLSDFKGFAEMGIISGGGVFLILAANIFLLPAALLLWHPGISAVPPARPPRLRRGIWNLLFAPRRTWIVLTALGCAGGVVAAFNVGFDYAVENLLPGHAESVVGMKILDSRTDFSMSYSIALEDSMEAAEVLRKKFAALPTVSRAEAISMFVPAGQAARLAILAQHKSIIDLANRADESIAHQLRQLIGSPDHVPGTTADREWLGKVHGFLGRMTTMLREKGFGLEDLPPSLRNRYVSRDGKHFAVIVFPKGDIGQKTFFEQHVAELLSVSKETTGHPVTHLEFTHMVHRGFRDAFILATAVVLLLIVIDLRDRRSLIPALIPVAVGLSFTLLFMWIFNIKFNYANLMALPILIGTGVDYGAHLAHRAKQEGSIDRAVRTTGRAITLTGLTTLVGFGSLMLGEHWGVQSLGILLVVGIGFSLIAALIVIPAAVHKPYGDRDSI